MNRKHWQEKDGHPPASLLLLHTDEELEGRAAETVRLHLDQCAACQLTLEQLDGGMARFNAFRETAAVPTPAPRVQALRQRLLREQNQDTSIHFFDRLRNLIRLTSPRPLALACGAALLCLVVWLSAYLAGPRQSVYASQILEDARNASDNLLSHSKVLNQKIRLRRGNLVIERDVHHGRKAASQPGEAPLATQMQQDLALAHIDWNDPLNAGDFAAWRTAQTNRTDSVRESGQTITITTRVPGATVTEGTLTLSRPDWRPIARSVEFRGEEPIEISEISYDIRDSLSFATESAAGNAAPSAAKLQPPAAPSEVSVAELEASELDLREALQSIGAEASASTEIARAEQAVLYRISPQASGQAAAIRDAAGRIPHVKEEDKQSGRLAEAPQTLEGSGPFTTTPPLAVALEARLGGTQAAHIFLDSLRGRSARMLAETAVLDQLARRYPADTVKSLSPGLRGRVNRLAAAMLSSLQHDTADYLKSLSPTLDAMARDRNILPPRDPDGETPGCLPWQQNEALAAPQVRVLVKDVSLLFLVSQTEKPQVPTADQLLFESLKARAFLEIELLTTCQLFG